MTMPSWWNERRLGVFVHATAASVPGWAPIGEYADWYRSHLGEDVEDVFLHPHPMVEVLAHHRDRWGHVDHYDDFVPLLTFEHFDADDWASVVADSGASYAVFVAKHHDGWAWWDAPDSERTLTRVGPRRNVLAEFAAALERRGIAFGTYYSLLDWGDDRYPDDEYVDDVAHRQVIDLVERQGSVMLWGDGHWGHDAKHWKSKELMDRVRSIDPDIVINDRWSASSADLPDGSPSIVRTFEYDPPPGILDGPWELTRAIGHSFGLNRAERSEHHLTAGEIVALYTEVLAKGGNLLLNVGPDADGLISSMQTDPLRDAGKWIRRHGSMLAATTPWTCWGNDDVRYLADGADVLVIDLTGRGVFAELHDGDVSIDDVEMVDEPDIDVSWTHGASGLSVHGAPPRNTGATFDVAVYRVAVGPPDTPAELFASPSSTPVDLAPLLADATAGDIVQLGDGTYLGPVRVPDGVTLRGLGPSRTTISLRSLADATPTVAPQPSTVELGAGSRLEHLEVRRSDAPAHTFERPVVTVEAERVTVLGCAVAGTIRVRGDDVRLRAVRAQGLRAERSDRLHVSRCVFTGRRWDVGIDLRGGGGHQIDSNELRDHLCAVRATETTGSTVRGNAISARWWGVHVDHCESAHVHGNRVSWTMRAVDIDGGTEAVVDGNAVTDGDSGCIVEDGASHCEVYGNHWDRCRIGLLAWDAVALHHQDNVASSLHEPDAALVTGP